MEPPSDNKPIVEIVIDYYEQCNHVVVKDIDELYEKAEMQGTCQPILGVHSRGAANCRQAASGSGGSQGLPESALRMASSAVMPWAAA
jgi:hypothetical protein